ncbi:MAG TPA: flagellar assembly protein FliW [Candidatus Methylacidiphilales bacterium]|jgi:flagellar assembly factor FliW|nr:flagellar assembly protein FliW [Candidatus Methylacidiphilales bacterium]
MDTATVENSTIETLRNKVIEFRQGLPGFPSSREFVMAQEPEERPFAWMQSVNEPQVRFAVVDAYAWDRDFALEVDDDALQELGSLDPLDYAVYFLLHIRKDEKGTTLQAKPNAPVLVNVRNRQARQVIVAASPSTKSAEALCLQL